MFGGIILVLVVLMSVTACSPPEDPTFGESGAPPEDTPVSSSPTPTPAPEPSALVFTEIMADPLAVSDGEGEWFELYNSSVRDIDLGGYVVENADGTSIVIDGVVIRPYEYVVFGRNAAYEENGGVPVTATYAGGFLMSNAADTLTLSDPDGMVVDAISWSDAPEGASISLDPSRTSVDGNDDSANLCPTRWSTLSGGDKGTPGALNDPCFPSGEVGSILFVEIMANPKAVDDSVGEYVELYNATTTAIRLDDWTLLDGSGGSHVFDSGGNLWIDPGGLLLLGNHYESSENGGISIDYSWRGEISLDDTAATLQLFAGDTLIDEVSYGSASFPDTPEGASLQLDPDAFDALSNDDGSAWCVSTNLLDESAPESDYGTAGSANSACGG